MDGFIDFLQITIVFINSYFLIKFLNYIYFLNFLFFQFNKIHIYKKKRI